MTQDELDALPEYKAVGEERIPLPDERYPDLKGDFVVRRFPVKGSAITHSKDDIAWAVDREGKSWSTGSINGVKHKIRAIF